MHLTLLGGDYIRILMSHEQFIKLLIRALYGPEKEYIKTEQVITVIEIILGSKEVDADEFLIKQGLIFFVLFQVFERKERNVNLKERVDFLRILLHEINYT